MKVVILAGGLGTRISEESHLRPKPMIEIGGQPILWHIMKIYSHYGFNEFIICCGYKGYIIKEYFADYYLHCSDVTFDFSEQNQMTVHNNISEPWKVTIVDTGFDTQTGGRIHKIKPYLNNERFMLTYGDGVSDINISRLITAHIDSRKYATISAIQPGGKFGLLDITEDSSIVRFTEKGNEDGGWVNGGFMVLEPEVLEFIPRANDCIFERKPLEQLASQNQLNAYKHHGFWQCMDTQRDHWNLEGLWERKEAPWKVW